MHTPGTYAARRPSRRAFLGPLGAAAGAWALGPSEASRAEPTGNRPPVDHSSNPRAGQVGRRCHGPPVAEATPAVTEALRDIGRPAGLHLAPHDRPGA